MNSLQIVALLLCALFALHTVSAVPVINDLSIGEEYMMGQPQSNNGLYEDELPVDKRAQTFVRFGKRAQTFVRFGKRAQTFVRFGRK